MPDLNETAAVESLESAFGITPPAPDREPTPAEQVKAEPLPEEQEAPAQADDAADGAEQDEAQDDSGDSDLVLDIEIDGHQETIAGADRVRELLAKGLKAGRAFEENARVREALSAHVQQAQMAQQFQQAVFGDVTELRALDAQLEYYNKIDWNAAFDSDAFGALKLKEQRDQLRERRESKVRELTMKEQQFAAAEQQGRRQVLAAESQALLAKLPEWRNAEKAASEQKAIASWLQNAGFNRDEIDGLMDHRALLVARKAYLYDQLQAGKADKVKQVRAAPPVVKPGAKPSPTQSGKADFAKFRKDLRTAGTKGQTRVQENLLLERLNRAFKA